ncbi:10331_t:CDS:1, partial [Cetraspora pellucida]
VLIYHDVPHDIHLARKIYRGLRPSIPTHVPKLITELIVKCWDAQSERRPNSKVIYDTINMWNDEVLSNKSTEFTKQIRDVDEVIEKFNISVSPDFKMHPEAIYSRRQLDSLYIADSDMHIDYLGSDIYTLAAVY